MAKRSQPGFTFLEILAVMALIAVVVGLAVGGMGFGANRIRAEAQAVVKALQAAHFQSLKQAKIYRVEISEDGKSFQVGKFTLPLPAPPKEDEEAYREWEEAQEEKQKALRELSIEERRGLSLVDRGEFELVKEFELDGDIRITKILHRQTSSNDRHILFFPTGETQSVLLLLEDEDGNSFSLTTNSITGRVEAIKGVISEEEWKQGPKTE